MSASLPTLMHWLCNSSTDTFQTLSHRMSIFSHSEKVCVHRFCKNSSQNLRTRHCFAWIWWLVQDLKWTPATDQMWVSGRLIWSTYWPLWQVNKRAFNDWTDWVAIRSTERNPSVSVAPSGWQEITFIAVTSQSSLQLNAAAAERRKSSPFRPEIPVQLLVKV